MILFELFNTKFKIDSNDILQDDENNYEVQTDIGGRKVNFLATTIQGYWDLEFSKVEEDEDGNEYRNYKQTNKKKTVGGKLVTDGLEMKVMSFVTQCMQDLIKKHNPEKIIFNARKKEYDQDEEETNRPRMYERLIKQYFKQYDYKRSDKGNTAAFMLTRKP